MVRAIDLNRMMRDSPILYRHFADPSFASMAIDDVGPLTRLGRTILSVPADITAQGLGLPELALKAGGEFLDWGAGNQPHANPLRDAGEWLGTIRQGQQALAEELRGDQSGAGFFEQGVLGGVSSFVQMLPGMLGTIATGNPAFALWAAGLQSGSTTAADAMDSGLPAWRSVIVGMTDGMIEAITEMAPAFKFVESMKVGDSFARFFGKQLMTELPGELLATLGQEYNAWAAGLRGDADLGEWVRTLPEAQAQTVIATLTMVALTSGLGRGAVRLLQDRKAAEEAPQKAERLRKLFELSSASALRQRAPETFAEFVDQAAADGQQTLYLDAEALAQSVRQMPPEELERALPGAAEQLARGERWVSVPLGAAMAGVPGTALEDLIVQHSKLDPEGLTLTEASAATEQADSLIATEIDRIQQEATDLAVVIEQIDRVRGVIEEQIVASGRHSPDVAAVQAEWLARAYTVLADAEGMTPDQLWAERPLIIRAQQGMAASNGVNAGDKLTQNTGPFGQVFTEYRGDAQGAIARLTQEQSGDATAALSHPEIGDIDLVWGKAGTNRHDGYGLAKLVRWHPEVLSDLQGLIGSMRVTQRSENRVHLESEDHEASVRLQWDGQSKHWLLTAYQKRGSDTGTRTDIAGADVADDSPPTASEAIVEQDMQQFYQAQAAFDGPERGKVVRAAFNPSEFAITLGPDTNLTSLHHESAHAFLELLHYLAARDGASERSRGMMDAALKWMGIAGDTPEERLAAWGAMSLNEKRAGHEQFAEGYEAYLFEGKAPTPELQRLMGRFRAWMKQAYGSLKQFFAGKGWQLDPEIRAVYDRILATDAEIRSAEERAGLVPDDAATTAAIEKLTAQSLRDLRWAREARNKTLRALQREAASKRKAVREEVAAEVMASPLEQVRKILRTTKEEDVNTPALMDALGVSSPEELARVLTLAPSAAEMIEAGTDRRMLERYGELTDPEALAAAADAAVHNEARARALAAELRAQDEVMGERADTGRRNARGARITENVVLEAGKRFADSIVRSTPVGELKAKRQLYLAAERKAARAQRAATAAGKTADAIAAQKDQLLNHLVAKGLMDAVDEADAAREEFKEYVKAGMKAQVTKGRDPAIVSMLRVIMGQYGIIERQAEKARDYLQMVQAFDPITSQRLEAIIAQAEQNAKPYKALTVDELQALRDLLGSIWEIAKTSRMMEVDGKQMRREDAAKMLLARMEEKGIPKVIPGEYGAITPGEERVLGLKGAMAWLVRVEQWTQAMDGKWGGPFTRLIFQPIKEAADRYRADRVVYLKKYEALIKQIEPYLHADPIVAHELGGYTFSGHTALLHALLHTGNESNKRKLLLGRQWASLREDGTMDTSKWDAFLQRMHDSGVITKAHWDFVQGVWDLLEETKPLAQATHRRVFGRFFDEVAADPVTTPFGTYRGGYVPAQADARQTPDAAVRALVEDQNASMINAFPEPARGFTKGRVEYNAPLLLDLGALRQHIDKVLLFAHMEGPVTDVTKLLTDKEVSNALFRISPHAYDTILLPWLKTASRQTVETPIAGDRGVHRLVTWMRSRSGMALMFANVSNTLQQVTGFVTALNKVKASSLRRAAARYIAHPADMTEVIKAKSIFMRNRIESEVSAINASMEKILINAGVFARAEMWIQEHAYFMQSAVDNVMWPIVWSAAYDEASARGESEKDAIRWADSVIRTTQGSQLPEDVARFETGNPWARLFSQFAGYFGMLANTSASELVNIHEQGLGLVRGAGKALMIGLYGVALPVWIAEAIAIAMRGGPEDDDDDGYLDDWMAAVFGWGSIRGATAMIPYAGQAVLGIATRLNDNPVDDKLSLSPAISLIESTVGVPANVYRAIIGKGTWAAAARSAAGGATLLTGLPIYAVARPISYTLGMAEGRIEPQGPWDATRGLITGTPSPESKQRP